VRTRVRADYVARLNAVTSELRSHAEAARHLVAQKRDELSEVTDRERAAAERLSEIELRHAVGEYDEAQWTHVHKNALAELVTAREARQAVESDIGRLEELDRLVRTKPGTSTDSRPISGKYAAQTPPPGRRGGDAKGPLDELAFLKSVTEDESGGPSPKRASGAHFQPSIPDTGQRPARTSGSRPGVPDPDPDAEPEPEAAKTLKCAECGTYNLPTEWYCEACGAELATV
jgi:hypothetical protein